VNGANSSLRFALLPNNFYKQPSIQYLDLRVSRRFTIHEDVKLELLAGRGSNLFNRTQVTSVNAQIYALCNSTGVGTGACPFAPGQHRRIRDLKSQRSSK
jgi:outer membrane receptor protein involved in Fe transport